MRVNKMMTFFSTGSLDSIRSLMDFWSDGTTSGGQLLDRSGNGNHATLLSNLITDGGAELNSSLDDFQPATPATTKASSNIDFHSGSRCFDCTLVGVAVSSGVKTKPFIIVQGETINWSFWIKRINATNLFYQISADDSGSALVSSTLLATTLNTWVQIQGSFVAPRSSGRCYIAIQGLAGTHAFRLDDISVTVTGQTDNCFYLPVNASMQAADWKNEFYDSLGVPLTVRAAYQYNADVNRIYCNGAFKYIFLKSDPDYSTDTILANQFENLDYAFDSCPIVLTVGSGKTYATVRDAELATHNGTFKHRRRIEVYDDETADAYAEYLYNGSISGPNTYKAFWQSTKTHTYFDAIGNITITGSKEVSATDEQLRFTEFIMMTVPGGYRGFNFEKSNGGYFMHQDFPGQENGQVILKDCSLIEHGLIGVLEYRIANALPAPALEMTWSAIAGGGHPRFRHILKNVRLESNFGLSWQDVADDTDGIDGFYRQVDCVAANLYDPIANPNLDESYAIRLFSSGTTEPSYLFFSNSTRNTAILKTGSPETLITTGI